MVFLTYLDKDLNPTRLLKDTVLIEVYDPTGEVHGQLSPSNFTNLPPYTLNGELFRYTLECFGYKGDTQTKTASADWDESKHPRDDDGTFKGKGKPDGLSDKDWDIITDDKVATRDERAFNYMQHKRNHVDSEYESNLRELARKYPASKDTGERPNEYFKEKVKMQQRMNNELNTFYQERFKRAKYLWRGTDIEELDSLLAHKKTGIGGGDYEFTCMSVNSKVATRFLTGENDEDVIISITKAGAEKHIDSPGYAVEGTSDGKINKPQMTKFLHEEEHRIRKGTPIEELEINIYIDAGMKDKEKFRAKYGSLGRITETPVLESL